MLKSFIKNTKGNVAIIMAVVILPLLLAVGSAVDYSNSNLLQTQLQDNVDVAALSAVQSESDTYALETFKTMLEEGGITEYDIKNFDFSTTAEQSTLTVDVEGVYYTAFMSIAGFKTLKYAGSTTVGVGKRLSAVTFTPTFGSGYLSKSVRLYVVRPNKPTPDSLATYIWNSTAAITNPDGSSPGTLSSNPPGKVELGDYEEFYISVRIWDTWNAFPPTTLNAEYGADMTIYSNEVGVGDHFFVDGVQLAANDFLDLTVVLNCESGTQTIYWEDLPNWGGMSHHDFAFDVVTECNGVPSESLRIIE